MAAADTGVRAKRSRIAGIDVARGIALLMTDGVPITDELRGNDKIGNTGFITVLASAPGKIYRARKFVRRHRIGVAAGAAIVLAIATGMAGTLWQARIARLEAARAVAVKDFLVEVLESTDPTNTQGRDPRASELLREGAKRIDHELSDRPLLRAELLLLIGRAQLAHARIEDAAHSLDSALILLRSGKVKDVGLII